MSTTLQRPFSITRYAFVTGLQVGVLLLGIRLLFPAFWASQFRASWGAFLGTFLVVHMVLAFVEWVFHRYVLHAITTSRFRVMADAHRNHHGLTAIKLQPVAQGSDRYILNRYPIVDEEQHEDSAFPWYSLLAFWGVFAVPFAIAQIALPHMPIVVAGVLAVAFSLTLYEVLHALEHYPYEWWKRATEHPRFGFLWRRIYGFHHMHHANVSCNEAISGFFGLPVPDWLFGTYHQPKELLLEGRIATAKDFAVRTPPRWVRWLDQWARKREAEIHHRAA